MKTLLKLHKRLNLPYVIQSTYNQDKTDNLMYIQVIRYSMVEKKDIVMIKVERETRKRLMAKGKKGDTYEDIISKMFEELEGDAGDKRQ